MCDQKRGSNQSKNHSRRQFNQLSTRLWNAHSRYFDSQVVTQQCCIYTRSKVLYNGHLQLLSQYTTEKKRICGNETCWFPRVSGGTLQTQRNWERWVSVCRGIKRSVWAPAGWNFGIKAVGREAQCGGLSSELVHHGPLDTWVETDLFHTSCWWFWGEICSRGGTCSSPVRRGKTV